MRNNYLGVINNLFSQHSKSKNKSSSSEFLKRSKRANRWYNPIEEIFEGNLEKECIEEACDFYEMNEIDDNWVISREKWEFYQKCHQKINNGRVCGDKDYNCKERIQSRMMVWCLW